MTVFRTLTLLVGWLFLALAGSAFSQSVNQLAWDFGTTANTLDASTRHPTVSTNPVTLTVQGSNLSFTARSNTGGNTGRFYDVGRWPTGTTAPAALTGTRNSLLPITTAPTMYANFTMGPTSSTSSIATSTLQFRYQRSATAAPTRVQAVLVWDDNGTFKRRYSAVTTLSAAVSTTVWTTQNVPLTSAGDAFPTGTDIGSKSYLLEMHFFNCSATNNLIRVDDLVLLADVLGAGSPPPSIVTSGTLPNGEQNYAYLQQLSATGGSGAGYTWSVSAGALPPGITLSGDKLIGIPTTIGTANFTLRVTDSLGGTVTKAFTHTTSAPPTWPASGSTLAKWTFDADGTGAAPTCPAVIAPTCVTEVTWGWDDVSVGGANHAEGMDNTSSWPIGPLPRLADATTRMRSFSKWDSSDSYATTRNSLLHISPVGATNRFAVWPATNSGSIPDAAKTTVGDPDVLQFSITLDPYAVGSLTTFDFQALRWQRDLMNVDGTNGPRYARLYAYYLNDLGTVTSWTSSTLDITAVYKAALHSTAPGYEQFKPYKFDLSGLSTALNATTAKLAGRKVFFDLYCYHDVGADLSNTTNPPTILLDDIAVTGSITCAPPPDYGDAPSYTAASAGNVAGTPKFGAQVDYEFTQPATDGADEDGVYVATEATQGDRLVVNMDVNTTAACYVNVWVDWNRDGDFADAGEQVVVDQSHSTRTAAVHKLQVPAGASPGASWLRARISTAPGAGPTGSTADGEVEDHPVTITDTVMISGVAWEDADNDGQRDAGERLLPGIPVQIRTSPGSALYGVTATDASGAYQLRVPAGTYQITFVNPSPNYGFAWATSNTGSDATDSDPSNVGWGVYYGTTADIIVPVGGADVANVDAGFVPQENIVVYTALRPLAAAGTPATVTLPKFFLAGRRLVDARYFVGGTILEDLFFENKSGAPVSPTFTGILNFKASFPTSEIPGVSSGMSSGAQVLGSLGADDGIYAFDPTGGATAGLRRAARLWQGMTDFAVYSPWLNQIEGTAAGQTYNVNVTDNHTFNWNVAVPYEGRLDYDTMVSVAIAYRHSDVDYGDHFFGLTSSAAQAVSTDIRIGSNATDGDSADPSDTSANKDDTTGTNDEDLTIPITSPGVTTTLSVPVTVNAAALSGTTARVRVFVDWNNDGDVADANETLAAQTVPASGSFDFSLAPPVGTALGTKYLRIRVTEGSTDPIFNGQSFLKGEVEDYAVNVVAPADFGDASGYGDAWATQAGATPKFGALLDHEMSRPANDNTTGADEDGVYIVTQAVRGKELYVNYDANVTGAAFVNMWIDWNRDGDFADAGEQVVTNQSHNSRAAGRRKIVVPESAVLGASVLRARISSASGAGPTGATADGEVEDYPVTIEDSIVISGVAFEDANNNGQRDVGERLLAGIHISHGSPRVDEILTDSSGAFSFLVPAGSAYRLRAANITSDGFTFATPNTGAEATDSDFTSATGAELNKTAYSDWIFTSSGGADQTADIGLVPVPGRVTYTAASSRGAGNWNSTFTLPKYYHADADLGAIYMGDRFYLVHDLYLENKDGVAATITQNGNISMSLAIDGTGGGGATIYAVLDNHSLAANDGVFAFNPAGGVTKALRWSGNNLSTYSSSGGLGPSALNTEAAGPGQTALFDVTVASTLGFTGATSFDSSLRTESQYGYAIVYEPSTRDYGDYWGFAAAYQTASTDIRIGTAATDAENLNPYNGTATGDDSRRRDDEDLTLPVFPIGEATDLTIPVTIPDASKLSGNTARINVWVDWNGDDDVSDANETLTAKTIAATGSVTFSLTPPLGVTAGTRNLRIRITEGGTDPDFTGASTLKGEVEDYAITTVMPVYFDFGDWSGSGAATATMASVLDTNLRLGAFVDGEGAVTPNAAATSDDTTDTDDEDGVTIPAGIRQGASGISIPVSVLNNTGANAYLHAWIDFNNDGSFNDAVFNQSTAPLGERLELARTITPGASAQAVSIVFNVPAAASVGAQRGVRFRVTDSSSTTPTTNGGKGEIEDYVVTIIPQAEFGDWNGAGAATALTTATVDANLRLGATIDVEPGVTADAAASADDTTGGDDEDGVTMPAGITQSSSVSIPVSVFNNTGANRYLHAWIDFNNDGTFNDTVVTSGGERLEAVRTIGTNASAQAVNVVFTVPAAASAGLQRGARFRLSDSNTTTPTTDGGTGEIEDYVVEIRQGLSIGNLVWNDTNNDGLKNGTEAGISGLTVQLWSPGADNAIGGTAANADTQIGADIVTNASGGYLFSGLNPGKYFVKVIPAAAHLTSGTPDTADNADDNDNNGSQPGGVGTALFSPVVDLALGAESAADGDTDANTNLTVDFGVFPGFTLGNLVWNDVNADGVYQSGTESGISGVTVELWSAGADNAFGGTAANADTLVAATTTNASGLYGFSVFTAGRYYVRTSIPPAYPAPSPYSSAQVADNGVDNNNNGYFNTVSVINAVTSNLFQLGFGTEPGTAGTTNVENTIDFGFRVCPTITITTASLPDSNVGVNYTQFFSQSGGTGSMTWALTSGSIPGVTLGTNGQFSGAPTTAGTYAITVQVTDSVGCVGSKNFNLRVCPRLSLIPAQLPDLMVGVPVNIPVSATGGTPPYTIVSNYTPPASGITGLTFASNTLSGTPVSEMQGAVLYTITDSTGCVSNYSWQYHICPPVGDTTNLRWLVPDPWEPGVGSGLPVHSFGHAALSDAKLTWKTSVIAPGDANVADPYYGFDVTHAANDGSYSATDSPTGAAVTNTGLMTLVTPDDNGTYRIRLEFDHPVKNVSPVIFPATTLSAWTIKVNDKTFNLAEWSTTKLRGYTGQPQFYSNTSGVSSVTYTGTELVHSLEFEFTLAGTAGVLSGSFIDFALVARKAAWPDNTHTGVGNLVYLDANRSGGYDAGEGFNGATVELYKQGATIGTSNPLARRVTQDGGRYYFQGVPAGSYFLHVPASNFVVGGPLYDCLSVTGAGADDGIDDGTDENGIDNATPATNGISSAVFALSIDGEPTATETGFLTSDDAADDNNSDLTKDFGFALPGTRGTNLAANGDIEIPTAFASGQYFGAGSVDRYSTTSSMGSMPVLNFDDTATTTKGAGASTNVTGVATGGWTYTGTDGTATYGPGYLIDSSHLSHSGRNFYWLHDQRADPFGTGAAPGTITIDLTTMPVPLIAGQQYEFSVWASAFVPSGYGPWHSQYSAAVQAASWRAQLQLDWMDGSGVLQTTIGTATDVKTTFLEQYLCGRGCIDWTPVRYTFTYAAGMSKLVLRTNPTANNSNKNAGIFIDDIALRAASPLAIGNLVWNDANNNGTKDAAETGVSGATVQLYRSGADNTVNTGDDTLAAPATTTSATGGYVFRGLVAGNYYVKVTPPGAGHLTSGTPDTADNADDNDNNGSQPGGLGTALFSPIVNLTPGAESVTDGDTSADTNYTVDFGLFSGISVGNLVFNDANNSGTYENATESGISGLTVELCDAAGASFTPAITTTTNASGNYNFTVYTSGTYRVKVTPNGAYPLASSIAGTDNGTDSNNDGTQLGLAGAVSRSFAFTLAPAGEPGTAGTGNTENTIDFGFRACPNIVVDPEFPATPQVGTAYSQTFTASGGTAPYTYTVSGGALPAWATLNPSTGALTGLPNNTTNATFTIRAMDVNGCSGTRSHTLTAVCPTITVSPGSLADAFAGSAYSQAPAFSATGLTGTYSWSASGVPGGMSFNAATRMLTGVPTIAGSYTVVVTATDTTYPSCSGVATINFRVCPTITVNPATLSDANIGVPFSATLSATNGSAPHVFTVVAGALPSWATLSPAGVLSGTPDNITPATFTVAATDSVGCAGTRSYTLTTRGLSIGNLVWDDFDNDGNRDAGEPGLPTVRVQLFRPGGDGLVNTGDDTQAGVDIFTDAGGAYLFDNLMPGDYFIRVTPVSGFPKTGGTPDTADNGQDNDNNGAQPGGLGAVLFSPKITLAPTTEPAGDGDGTNGDLTVDFGLHTGVQLGNLVWNDANDNGLFDAGVESGLTGVTVQLLDGGTSALLATTITTTGGGYGFTVYANGAYRVRVLPPASHAVPSSVVDTADNAEDNDNNGSQPGLPGTPVLSNVFTITAGNEPGTGGASNTESTIDIGLRQTVTVGNLVFKDVNNDGLYSAAADTVAVGVVVQLFAQGADPLVASPAATTTSDAAGHYLLSAAPGSYFVYVPASEFGAGKPLENTRPSLEPALGGIPAVDDDGDQNALTTAKPSVEGVRTPAFTLNLGGGLTAATGETGNDSASDDAYDTNADLTVDLGFYPTGAPGFPLAGRVTRTLGGAATAGEPLQGVTVAVYEDADGSGTLAGAEMSALDSTTTNADGAYEFLLPPGDYLVMQEVLPGATAVADSDGGDPTCTTVEMTDAACQGVDFTQALAADTFAQWQEQNALGGENGVTQNPDGDLYDNLLEYALGTPAGNGLAARRFRVEHAASGTMDAVLTRPVNGREDVRYTLEGIADLALSPHGWSALPITPLVTVHTDGTESLRFADLESALGSTGFVRVKVTLDADQNGTPEAAATTPAQGWSRRVLAAGSRQTLSMPLPKPELFAGTVLGSTGSALTIADTGLGTLPGGASFYVEVLTGAKAGHRLEVNAPACTATMIVLAPGNDGSGLSGARVALRAHWTLRELLPPALFTAANSAAQADRVLFFDSAANTYQVFWVHAGSTPRWVRDGDATLADAGARVIGPVEGMMVQVRASAVTLPLTGQVRSGRVALPLAAGSHLIGTGAAVALSPSTAAMSTASGFIAGGTPETSSRLRFWLGDQTVGATGYGTWSLQSTGSAAEWRLVGGETDLSGEKALDPFRAVFLMAPSSLGAWALPPSWAE